MLGGRFTLIIICSALTNLAGNSYWATKPTVWKISVAQQQLSRPIAIQSKISSEKIATYLSRETPEATLATQSQIFFLTQIKNTDHAIEKTDNQAAGEINKSWFVAAMAVTSSLSLFLLWILFKKPTAKPETVKELPAVSQAKVSSEPEADVPAETIRAVAVSPQVASSQANNTLLPSKVDTEQKDNPRKDNLRVEGLPVSDSLIPINSGKNYIDVVAELTQDLRQGDRHVRRKAIWELAKLGDSRVIEPLMAIMPQASSVDKSLIIKAITQITRRSFQPINAKLFAMLEDSNPQVRVNAILDISAFYKFVVPLTQHLTQMQFDENQEVRNTAAKALHNLNLGDSVSLLQNYTNNQVGEITVRDNNNANHL